MKIVNFVLFQVCWFACVYFAGQGLGWPGAACVIAFGLWHLSRDGAWRREWLLVFVVCLFGFGLDTFWVQTDVLDYQARGAFPEVAPVWIVALWANFALTINHSLSYLRGRPLLCAALGAIGGPVSYWVAIKVWDAASTSYADWQFTLIIAFAWALATPLFFWIADKITAPPRVIAEEPA